MSDSVNKQQHYDVVIIGAGAAGLMCAAIAGQRGRRVLVLDHANKVGKKILMSGGGRCNFTNLYTTPEHFFSENPHFCKSALKRYTPYDFLALVDRYGVEYVDKEEGQLFCKYKAKDILNMLLQECAEVGVKIRTRCHIERIEKNDDFSLHTTDGLFYGASLVVATGGLSIPTLGASGFGYQVAQQFGIPVIPARAALVPFTLSNKQLQRWQSLAGLALDVEVECRGQVLRGAMLFTHRGFSGPVMLQISSYWREGDELVINLAPHHQLYEFLSQKKQQGNKQELHNLLADVVPKRLAQKLCELHRWSGSVQLLDDDQLHRMADAIQHWTVKPAGTEGYRTAEVTLGGVDTRAISSKTMQADKVPGLYFIGEVLDVTGQLGGFNFQWAWSSAWAAGQYV